MNRRKDNQAGERTYTVLKTLVEEYIGTAAPVPSEQIARRSPMKISSATVRNKMAELEGEGYIVRPHISSGGVPSTKGYRFYIGSLDEEREPSAEAQRRVRERFGRSQREVEAWIGLAAMALSELSQNFAIVTHPRKESARVKYLHLVLLQEFLALLIVVLEETRLKKQLIPLRIPVDQGDLTTVANKLTDAYAGLTYRQMLAKSVELTPFEETVARDAAETLREDGRLGDGDYRQDGLRLLLGQPEFEGPGKAQEALAALEERTLLNSILAEAPESGGMALTIGDENAEESLRPFSIVLCQYGAPEELFGTVAVIGPTRMEYADVMGGVRFMSGFMGELLSPPR